MARFAKVALDLPLSQELTYLVPETLQGDLVRGCRVRVPLGRRRLVGVVVDLTDVSDVEAGRLRPVEARVAETPALPRALLDFTKGMAEACACSWGTALEAAWPAPVKRRPARTVAGVALVRPLDEMAAEVDALEAKAAKRARVVRAVAELGSPAPLLAVLRRAGVTKAPVATLVAKGLLRWVRLEPEPDLVQRSRLEHAPRHPLTPEQRAAVDRVTPCLERGEHESFLLWGITGSGKTEVYLRILEETRRLGRGGIILVPEIALTPQTLGRFLSRFPDAAVLHSSLPEARRASEWLRLLRGQSQVVVGTRSALFAPVRDLGLIVVDEEHEASFKQQQSPRYHARDMAVLRGQIEHAAVVLGSATPSLEAWQRAAAGQHTLLRLPARVGLGRLPRVIVADMRHEKPRNGSPPLVSRQLEALMTDCLASRDQVLLFLNRRGFAPVLYCSTCGETVKCRDCDIAMTWHVGRARLLCHYCMAELRRPELCPTCNAAVPVTLGAGTERVEDWVKQRFPAAVVARMDSDTMTRRDSYEKVLGAFRQRQIDVLVGTQMIAKGLDFPGVTLVGVISADTGLFQPDFRAAERCFQLLAQVAGRAGRGEREGLVVLQTLCPHAEPVVRAAALDYEGFVAGELAARRELGYPPFTRLVRVVVESADAALARRRCDEVAAELARLDSAGRRVLGPAPAPLTRVRRRWRFHLLVKCASPRAFAAVRALAASLETRSDRRARVLVDVDPQAML